MSRRHRWRFSKPTVPMRLRWGVLAIATIAAFAVPTALGMSWSNSLGVSGMTLAVGTFAIQESASHLRASRTILFVSSSRSEFTRQIADGLREGLSEYESLVVREIKPATSGGRMTMDEQLQVVRSAAVQRASALVLRPAGMSSSLCAELWRLARAGVPVVLINTSIPASDWPAGEVPPPHYIGADMWAGGELVGALLVEAAQTYQADAGIILKGPSSKRSNRLRADAAASVVQAGAPHLTTVVQELTDFDGISVTHGMEVALREVDRLLGRRATCVAVHTGTDTAASAISSWAARSSTGRKYSLIGFDGLTYADGSLVAATTNGMFGTVSQRPFALGLEAALHLAAVYDRVDQTRPAEVLVHPNIVRIGNPPC